MNYVWQRLSVPFKFQLSDKTLFAPQLSLNVCEVGLTAEINPVETPAPPEDVLEPDCHGFLIRSLPVRVEQPTLRWLSDYLCYVPSQYQRYYIDLGQSFVDYTRKFSSKTRSTINRKIKKFADYCDGHSRWRVYKTTAEVQEFYHLARLVSAKTYQEKLLDAGLPESQEFLCGMMALAAEDCMRGYILFDRDKPVAYLYCPSTYGVLLYQYLGYDPGYMHWSVGTILQWHALEDIFNEGRFRIFDFTEGQSDHKRQFSTHSVQCANVYFLRKSVGSLLLVQSHRTMNASAEFSGAVLERLGLKTKIKRLIRFGRRYSAR